MPTVNLAVGGRGTKRAGFLLHPLGWLNERLSCLNNDPALLTILFELDPYRMHCLAMGLAHSSDPPSATFVRSLIHESDTKLINQWPTGMRRALQALSNTAMPPKHYRLLTQLLADHSTAKYLHHRRSIDEKLIVALAALPNPLRRPPILKLFDEIEGMECFIQGLEYLSARTKIAFDSIIGQLASLRQTEQVVARIANLVDSLPLSGSLPEQCIGSFRRIDGISEIKTIARIWQNCISEYLYAINDCTAAFYLLSNERSPAIAFLFRADRIGWAVDQIKGPKNLDLKHDQLIVHYETFAKAGVPKSRDIAAIKNILLRRRSLRCHP